MEGNQVKLENLGTWLSGIFFSFLLTFLQSIQRNNLAVQKAVNSREGSLGWGSSMVKAWREPEEIHRLAGRAIVCWHNRRNRLRKVCGRLPSSTSFPSAGRDFHGRNSSSVWWGGSVRKGTSPSPGPLSPLGRLCCSLRQTGLGIAAVFCSHALTEPGSSGGSKLIFFLSHLHVARCLSRQNY